MKPITGISISIKVVDSVEILLIIYYNINTKGYNSGYNDGQEAILNQDRFIGALMLLPAVPTLIVVRFQRQDVRQ
jgi:hypothetical protein